MGVREILALSIDVPEHPTYSNQGSNHYVKRMLGTSTKKKFNLQHVSFNRLNFSSDFREVH